MDFFQSQDVARRKTALLVAYFVLAIVLMIAAIYAAAVAVFSLASQPSPDAMPAWWYPDLLAGIALVTLAVIALGSLYKTWELRAGGERVASMLGGRRVDPHTTRLEERRLLNVVEEMALASGVPVPPVFVLDREPGINAFAAGYTPGDAVIGVSRGTLDHLTRDELQGVMAHEFSHILNGDMRLNLRLIGLLHGILLVAIIGYYMMRFGGGSGDSGRRSSKGGGGQIVLLGLAVLAIGYTGLFFARLIKAAVSRQREYLADAAAVQFTRNPGGIAGALKKIGALAAGSHMETAEAEVASHMFFGNAIRNLWFEPFATHPPLVERIRRIDPQFDGQFPRLQPVSPKTPAAPPAPPRARVPVLGDVLGPAGARLPLDPSLVLAAAGAPNRQHVAYAQQVIGSLPERLAAAVRSSFSARAVVLAMLLDRDERVRGAQLEAVQRHLGSALCEETLQLAPLVAAQGPAGRLPLVQMAQPTLRQMSLPQYRSFRAAVEELVQADREVSMFEFALQRVLLARLDRHFFGGKPVGVRYPALGGLTRELASVLSALAHLGHSDERAARQAFAHAYAALGLASPLELRSREECRAEILGPALDKLAQSAPPIKKRLLNAAIRAVSLDGRVTLGEAELLRAVADSLDCPLPPLLAGQAAASDSARAAPT